MHACSRLSAGGRVTYREFNHNFFWNNATSSWSGILPLSTTDIAEAATLEIIQLSLSASPFDLLLEHLLTPGISAFEWVAQLGHIRETKTALSGLFGRFIARAYLTQLWGYEYFDPLHLNITPLSAAPHSAAIKVAEGDLPDWLIATSPSSRLIAIAEGKGSHDTSGPWKILEAAKQQARRVDIFNGIHRKFRTKRFAVVTRWAVSGNPKLNEPWLVVDDPDEGEVTPSPEELAYLRRGIALGHYAALCRGLGLPQTAKALERAKNYPAGSLVLPEEEFVTVAQEDEPRKMATGILAGSGIIRVPSDISDNYLRSVSDVFQGRAILVGVGADAMLKADQFPLASNLDIADSTEVDDLPSPYSKNENSAPLQQVSDTQREEVRSEGPTSSVDENPDAAAVPDASQEEPDIAFWKRRRSIAAGFEFRPLENLAIYRSSAG